MFYSTVLVHNTHGTILIISRHLSGSMMLAGADFAGGGCGGNGGYGGYGGFAAEPHSELTRDLGRLPRWGRTLRISGWPLLSL